MVLLLACAGPPAGWETHPRAAEFVHVEPFTTEPGLWLALVRAPSGFDDEDALRPYVFAREGDRWVDRWRGTALARPLVEARLVVTAHGERLCALHRGDSFLAPDPSTPARRWRAYRWTGFGFVGADEDPDALCARR